MIRLESISKSYPDKELFTNVNISIRPGMRIGLVGANGTGKTTLLRMILKEEFPDSGAVTVDKGQRLGYLPQEIISGSNLTIIEEVLSAWPEVGRLEHDMLAVSRKIAETPHNAALLERLGKLQMKFEQLGGWTLEEKAQKYLSGLGFAESDFSRNLTTFSGGWRMRVALAGILLKAPDFLLLDEPTNHLDLEATIWFENFLQERKGGLIIISHDREFLDRAVTHILELENGRATLYRGNYSHYQEEKILRLEQQTSAWKNQQKKIRESERFIERFRYKSTKARQVQSRIKQLEKLERIDSPEASASGFSLRIPQPDRGPLKVAELKQVTKSYGPISVYSDLNLLIERGQKIGLVGPNGAGKSTLLKLLAGVEPPTSGKLEFGPGVARAYFAQHQLEILDPEKTLFDTIRAVSQGWSDQDVRRYLGGFLFTDDSIEKLVKVLSGGEKSRLAFAKMLVAPAQLLLLDEPTNHLDIVSRDVIIDALLDYKGAIVCISHDRYFLNVVIEKTIEIIGGSPTVYDGNYNYYQWKKSTNEEAEPEPVPIQVSEPDPPAVSYREQKRQKNRLLRINAKLTDLEQQMELVQEQISDPEIARDYEKLEDRLSHQVRLETDYLQLLEEKENFEQSGIKSNLQSD